MNHTPDNESKIWKRLKRKEKEYEKEQRFLRKRSEEYEALEEVFDKPTLMSVYKLLNEGIIKSFQELYHPEKKLEYIVVQERMMNQSL